MSTRYVWDEQEFIRHICRILEEKLDCPSDIDFSHMIGLRLHDFMHIRAVDAMEWVLKCAMGDMPFEQRKEDEIPILCKYYDSFISRENWTDDQNTIMTVLTKYYTLKAKGYGNFARSLETGAIYTSMVSWYAAAIAWLVQTYAQGAAEPSLGACKRLPVLLPPEDEVPVKVYSNPNSLLVMDGSARVLWAHALPWRNPAEQFTVVFKFPGLSKRKRTVV